MRIIKLAIISFVFFFLLITGISLFIPSTVRVSRAVEISAASNDVMTYINDPVNWKYWFHAGDTIQYLYIEGKIKGIILDSSQGLQITEITNNTVKAGQIGSRSQYMTMGWEAMPGSIPGKTTLQWWMELKLRWYPWEKFKSLFFENQYGVRMEMGLTRLKKLLENN
jgi:hypothetical protein